MPLLDTDRELTRDSYYLRTAPAWQPSTALEGEAGEKDGQEGG